MTYAPVGIKCPEHASVGAPRRSARPQQTIRRTRRTVAGLDAPATVGLVALNVLVYLVTVSQGGGVSDPGGEVYNRGLLLGVAISENGDWYRLVTSMFLHASILHLGLNMLFLWWVGAPVEEAVGRWRFALIYLAGGLGGAAGALLFGKYELFGTTLATPTVGASGALFGILGAALVYERQRHYVLGGAALSIIVLNLVLSFTISGISIGGHLGGLVAGALAALALSRLGTQHAIYGRPGLAGVVGVLAIALGTVAVAYWAVADYI